MTNPTKFKFLTVFAIVLIILSCVLFCLIFALPFLPIPLSQKGIWGTVLFIGGETFWWLGIAIVGKQMITKYKKYLNPRNWYSDTKDSTNESDNSNQ